MKKLTAQELARLGSYIAAVLLGIFMTVWGVVHGDAALIGSGVALIGTGGLAGANVGTRGDHAA